jgi:hypothetical protein
MSVKSKIAAGAIAGLALAGAAVCDPRSAQAQQPHFGASHFGASHVRELHVGNTAFDDILNGALAANRSYYGTGDPRCPLVRTSDRHGNPTGWIHTCMRPPTVSHGVLQLRSPRLIVGDEDQRARAW